MKSMKNLNKKLFFGFIGLIFLSVAVLTVTAAPTATAKSGLLSMDLIIDDGWFYAVDDTVATDPDDVFLEEHNGGLETLITPPTDRLYFPKNLDVDLEKCQWYSDPNWAANELGGSRLFMNSSATAGVYETGDTLNATITSEMSFSGDYGEAKLTATGSIDADTKVMWSVELEEDRDADGITDETGDEEWLTQINGDEWFLVHLAMAGDVAAAETDSWASVELVFKTTSGYYTYEIRGYDYAGDTDVTVGSVSNGETASFYSLASSTTFEHVIFLFDMGAVVSDDSESPSIVGLDRIEYNIQLDSTATSKYITLRSYNIVVFREEIGFTDNIDDDTDYDYDTAGIPGNFDDDSDFPSSEITDEGGATDDTYDNLLALEHAIDTSKSGDLIIKAPMRKLYLVSNTDYEMELNPNVYSEVDVGGYNDEKMGYLIRSHAEYDWNWLDYGGNPTSYISWTASSSKLLLEFELEYDQMCYEVDTEDDPGLSIYTDVNGEGGYILQGVEQTAELIATFDGQTDDTAVTDVLLVEPSQTIGGSATTVDLSLFMRHPSRVIPEGAPAAGVAEAPGFFAWILGGLSLLGGIFTGKWLRGK